VVWTAPTGHRYTTYPGGGLFFPALAVPTGELIVPEEAPRATARGVMMPRRRRTRADDRNYRRSRERRLNEQRLAEEQRQRESWLAATYEPPPF
ncbi:MAG: HNH endonuclease, partial [Candidatus Sericytochromatia bacterium]